MTLPHRAFIALGANLGDPAAAIRLACEVLADLDGVELRAVSSLYRTAPIGLTGQPDFINAVAEIATDLDPQALLALLLGIEAAQGRIRHEKNGPRTIDLDLLLYDDLVLDLPELTLPHPRLHQRAFV
ncbi:MAG TPA: 2-amino-4-hydroxy-6-hydroxymethyldihydropteridine diphosphokinase, partial [Rhodocyclaceae bacterium]|nr:2-amino-4-hydroxy-6-hydroxymethyldihydropteridine diphosphokinase [Rhodocyclaceae bacterium]